MAFLFRSLGDGRGGRVSKVVRALTSAFSSFQGWAHPECFVPHHGESTSRLAFLPIAAQCIHPWCWMGIRNHYSRLNGNFDCGQTFTDGYT